MSEALQSIIKSLNQIRAYRHEHGEDHPKLLKIWDGIIANYDSLTQDEKQQFDEALN